METVKNPEEQENRMNETNENQDAENDDSENQKLKAKLESSENQITDMTKKISDYEDLLKRKQAEFENYRKRTLREKDDFQKSANQKFLEELLPIVDNFEKAIASSSDNSDKTTIMDGLLLIEKQLKKLLETHGVEVIQSVGEEFDPNLHEAIQMEEGKDEYVSDTVIKEWQKGYLLNEKVIRHSKVVVAKGTGQASGNPRLPEELEEAEFQTRILDKLNDEDKRLAEEFYELEGGRFKLNKALLESDASRGKRLVEILAGV